MFKLFFSPQVRALLFTILYALSPLTFADALKIGMSTDLSGPAKHTGKGFSDGVKLYFQRINASGGVHGDRFELIVYDDGYDLQRSTDNILKLLDQDKVLAILGNAGPYTGPLAALLTRQRKTLFFAPQSGSTRLRQYPPDRYLIHFRASYTEEINVLVEGLLQAGIEPSRIAFFTQHGEYGNSAYRSARVSLKLVAAYSETKSLAHGRYAPDTQDIEEALSVILPAAPQAIIMVGAAPVCAKLIEAVRPALPDTVFAGTSFVDEQALRSALKHKADNVVIMQTVPNIDADLPGVREYRQDLQKYAPEQTPSHAGLEGYLAAKTLVAGVQKIGARPMQETLINALESLQNYDPGIGATLSYSKDAHDGLSTVWPGIIQQGKLQALAWENLQTGMAVADVKP